MPRNKSFWVSVACFISLVVISCGYAEAAAPLADKIPADAVAYIGWAGADSQAAVYQASDLSVFVEHSNLPDLAKQYFPKWWDEIPGLSDKKQAVAALQKALPLLWRHPVAVYAWNVSVSSDGTPGADFALVCDAGTDAGDLASDLRVMVKDAGHLHVSVDGALVTLAMDKSADEPAAAGRLRDEPRFIAAMSKLQASPAIAVYVDAKTLLLKADRSAEKDNNAAEIWPKVRDALGITYVKTFAMTAGFDGGNWMTASMLEAPAPRSGLLAAIEPRAIDPALLARVPESAGSVSVYNLDLAKLYDTLGDAMAVRDQSDKVFHTGTGALTMVLGRPFRKAILGPLGPQWVLYADSKSQSKGPGPMLLNHPTDADTASDSMVSAAFGLMNLTNAQIPGASTQPVVNANQVTLKGVDVTSAVMKSASPSFAVKNSVLYLGLTPESVVMSATMPATAVSKDLLHSVHFQAAVKRLGIAKFASFSYCDLPGTAPLAYDNFGAAGAQLRKVMGLFGLDLPKVQLPPLDQIKSHLSPALSVAWADADGIYCKSVSPFPFATQLLGDPQEMAVSVASVSVLSAVVVPAMQRARVQALSVQTMSRERQIMLGVLMYAANHHGQFPADLGSIVSNGEIDSPGLTIFLKAGSDQKVPAEISNGTKDQQAAWVNASSEFAFLTPNRKNTDGGDSDTPVIVPKDADQATDRVPVGFADGHVESCKAARARHFLHPDN